MAYRLGVDVGGTFTDIVLLDETTGASSSFKVPSSRDDPARPVIDGARLAMTEVGGDPSDIRHVAHGCTIATNAVIERRGVRTALLVTRGFRGLLEIGRLETTDPFSFDMSKTVPLVPRARVIEVGGRLNARGEAIEAIDGDEVRAIGEMLADEGIEAVGISLLHSHVNSAQEHQVAVQLKVAYPHLTVLCGCDLWPAIGEYERAYLAVLNAYIMPMMTGYMHEVESGLRDHGIASEIFLPTLNAGVTTLSRMNDNPIATVTSGLTAGAQAAADICRRAGIEQALTLDIGGTSADFACIEDGEPVFSTTAHVGGFPVAMPSVWLKSIGAGGGSIAWIDSTGVLKVGPHSAGAVPGPACYGRGGQQPTLTDAYLLCGYLGTGTRMAGRMPLDVARAEAAIALVADPLGVPTIDAAESIIRIATSLMSREILAMLSERGVDPRHSVLIAFGGAGPVHAHWLLEEFRLREIVIPSNPGTLSALGTVISPIKEEAVVSLNLPLSGLAPTALAEHLDRLESRIYSRLAPDEVSAGGVELRVVAEMRYRRQAFTLDVSVDRATIEADPAMMAEAFHRRHAQIYRHVDRAADVVIVNLRATGIVAMPPVTMARLGAKADPLPVDARTLRYDRRDYRAAIYRREDIGQGSAIVGPAIVEQSDTTTVVPPGFVATADADGLLHITMSAPEQ